MGRSDVRGVGFCLGILHVEKQLAAGALILSGTRRLDVPDSKLDSTLFPREENRALSYITMGDPRLTKTKRWLKNRRSQRINLDVPVVVSRPRREGPEFSESTRTLVVSAHGALMVLRGMVAPKQRLLLQNSGSGEQQECRVVYVNNELVGPPTVAVEFARPAPRFWHIAFPPSNWISNP